MTASARGIQPPVGVHDQGIPWHFGDPLREQRHLAQGSGIVDISNRGVLTVSGPDRLTWLHSLTTQHLLNLSPGESTLALILSPQGHVEFELHLIDDGATTWVILQPGQADPLAAYLRSMVFMLRVEVADRSSDFSVVWEPMSEVDARNPTWLVPDPFADRGYRGREVVLAHHEARARLEANPMPAGSWALEALRVAALMPRIGCETDHRTIPNEVGWLGNAVHLNKGCYRGQETVAKVNNLGQPPRRLGLLLLDGSSENVPGHGEPVLLAEREVGWIGSAAQHYELGPIASAMVKRRVPLDATVQVADGAGMSGRFDPTVT